MALQGFAGATYSGVLLECPRTRKLHIHHSLGWQNLCKQRHAHANDLVPSYLPAVPPAMLHDLHRLM